ncbi:glycosyltransferase family 4 protein [Flavobacterium johnsoniae]|uniref:Glycosyltransferase family 4 n=1 Tax=Flavobacterium johnsoniae (strain ATCC 17061 / DSM 2064 / JCM 8514 / BCRC 14874 / CCUG 350202 / NBRC 14942 / NCIMB 11054 / UW101) TaxID=376686 RepID=A5FL46_FLAJ1|nr:glycosyltransferase family 4 protein [Flavobacterium johnsoniae]ABQ04071.1 Glycosyltransferase family 4 [Flavobacterium johnsoniae UW101]OXG02693.1 glycosyltransferase WbuB [Flavobacterium johnsoniae UW101]WQG79058.1 glycosyltransferase family 4 protein [Flavobacterium johnsoniae UW101]SHK11527.1 Glycosyltransferase involved in cell wall bisynthesis [Flavobacterium johnsoniae]
MKDILIISNYYPPEKGAAANRIEQLALKLDQNGYNVSVISPLPNYPKGELFPEYKNRFSVTEKIQNITLKRLWIYPSNSSNIFKRIVSTLSFSTTLFFYLLFSKIPKKVIVQSPPLLLSFTAVLALWLRRKKIILNVSDLWPTAAIELGVLKKNSISHKFLLFIERFIYRKANHIFGQSNEIIDHIHSIFPEKKCFLYRNYPDHFIENRLEEKQNLSEPIKLFYAGLLGVAQGVFELIQELDLKNLNIELHIFGDGAEKNQILNFLEKNQTEKIIFHGMLERNVLHKTLQNLDIALVPLKTRIYGSVPSKIFEYSALGFPVLYFGGGEGENIVEENNLGWVVPVEDFKNLNDTLKQISEFGKEEIQIMKKTIFLHAKSHFNLDEQMKKLIENNAF